MAENLDPTPREAAPSREAASSLVIPDHRLVRLIGRGSYGEVWLAQNTLGTYRAVKIVYEKTFRDKRPFEREFNGVKKFEPISRLHDGLVDVLQVGRNDDAGYFYCVMEVADDVATGPSIAPDDYLPRTLACDMARHKKLPFDECQRFGAAMASALAFLHKQELIHRDVKPSNIVFVNGVPKLADIGLVAEMADAKSYVGTEGFIPPEGPGTVQADIYSLGKVLYEISTGKDRRDYPDLPTYLGDGVQKQNLIELNRVIWKACRADPRQRYKSAQAMAAHLVALDASAHARFRKAARRFAITSLKIGAVAACLAGVWTLLTRRDAAPSVAHHSDTAPISGAPGAKITIAGPHFSPTPADNIVHFGAVQGQVLSVTPSNLVAAVPFGATYAPISITTTGVVTYSSTRFLPTFDGSAALAGPSNFALRVDLPANHGPNYLAVADFDGDGKPDLAVAEFYSNTLSLYRNTSADDRLSTNSFAAPVVIPFAGGANIPYQLAAADVDRDGKIDLIVPDRHSCLMIFKNRATPGTLTTNSFAAPVCFFVSLDARAVVVRDLDGDGRPDIVAAANGTSQISILQGIGRPGVLTEETFAPVLNLPAVANPIDLAVEDLDGDGKPDLAVVNSGGTVASLYRNISSPGTLTARSFGPRVDLPVPYNCVSIAAGDVDGDSKVDLLVGSYTERLLRVHRNIASPGSLSTTSFAPGVDFLLNARFNNLALGDVTGDGKPDVAVVAQLPSQLSVFQNLSTPGVFDKRSLGTRIDLTTRSNATGVVIADLSGDGRPDIIFGNTYSSCLSIYQNLTPFKVPTAASGAAAPGAPPATKTAPIPAPAGLIAWWRGEHNGNDSAGNNPIAHRHEVTFGPGKVGQGFRFDGKTHRMIVSNAPPLNVGPDEDFSIEAWIQPLPTETPYGLMSIAVMGAVPDDTQFMGYELCLLNGKLQLILSDRLGRFAFAGIGGTGPDLRDGRFHHVAATVQRTSRSGGKLYADGKMILSFDPTSHRGALSLTNALSIGNKLVPDFETPFRGTLDELSLYDRALSAAEIQSIYNADSAGKHNPRISSSTFEPKIDLAAESGPHRIAVADFDGDAKPDFAVAASYAQKVSVYRNVSARGSLTADSFELPFNLPMGTRHDHPVRVGDPPAVTAADVDDDGKSDLIVPHFNGNVVAVFKNISSPAKLNFAPPVCFAVGREPKNIAAGDFDGDHRQDLAVINQCISEDHGTVSILRNTGAPGIVDPTLFAPGVELEAGPLPSDIAAGDFDGDGKLDLIVSVASETNVFVFRNRHASGTLDRNSFERMRLSAPTNVESLAVGDVDRDGRLDFVLGLIGDSLKLSLYRNVSESNSSSGISFAPAVDFSVDGWVNDVALGDLDNDGRTDIALATQLHRASIYSNRSSLSVFQNLSAPGPFIADSLGPRLDFESGWNAGGVALADLDGDGSLDVIIANAYTSTISVYRNTRLPPAP